MLGLRCYRRVFELAAERGVDAVRLEANPALANRIFLAIGEGQPPAARDLDVFNSALAEAPRRLGVSARGGAYGWIVSAPTVSGPL